MRNRSLLLLVLAAFLAAAPAGAAQPRVKLATLAPRGSSFHQYLVEMGEAWRKAPAGGAALTIYPDGSMGSEADMVRKMRIGQIQAAMLTGVGLKEIDDSVAAVQLMPMMFRSLDEVSAALEHMRPRLEKALYDKGFVVLFWGDAGWVRLFTKDTVLTPDDLKKTKLSTIAGDTAQNQIMKAAGYQPVPLEVADLLPAFQTGMIDAMFTIPYFALSSQIYQRAPHMLELDWAPLIGGTVITRKAWDDLPEAAREALRASALAAGDKIRARSRAESDEAVEAMRKRGLQVHPMTPQIEAAWRSATEAVYPQIRGAIIPADLFDDVRSFLEKRRGGTKAAK